jgi:hypothetical protein
MTDLREAFGVLVEAEPECSAIDPYAAVRASRTRTRTRRQRWLAGGVAVVTVVGIGVALVGPRVGGATPPASGGPAAADRVTSSASMRAAFEAFEASVADHGWGLGTVLSSAEPTGFDDGVRHRFVLARDSTSFELDVTIRLGSTRSDGVAGACADIGGGTCTFAAGATDPVVTAAPAHADVDERDIRLAYPSGTSVVLVAHRPFVRTSLVVSDQPVPVSAEDLAAFAAAIGDPDAARATGLEVPEAVVGEVARAVLSDPSALHTGKPDASVTYVVRAACAAADRSDELQYEVRDNSANGRWAVITSGSVPCDGTVVQNSASPLPAHRLSIALIGPAVASGYAVLVPYPSLAEQQKQDHEIEAKQQRDKTQHEAQDAQEQQLALQHPCAAGDLTATARRVEGGTQTYADVLTFTNTSGTACGVSGVPTVGLGADEPLGFSYTPGQYLIFLPDSSATAVLIQPGEAALVYLSKPGCSRTTVAVARTATVTVEGGSVEVRLPGSGQGALALCGPEADDPGNLVRVTPFQPYGPR